MRLPSFRRIFKTDFDQEFQGLIEQLSENLNSAIEVLYDLANKKISLRDNVLCSVKDVDVTVDTNGKPTTQVGMSLDQAGKVDGLIVIRVDNLQNAAASLPGAPFISFTPSEKSVLFNHITGLQPNTKYRLRVIAFQS